MDAFPEIFCNLPNSYFTKYKLGREDFQIFKDYIFKSASVCLMVFVSVLCIVHWYCCVFMQKTETLFYMKEVNQKNELHYFSVAIPRYY